jgi:small conductance mechanosensitive channel
MNVLLQAGGWNEWFLKLVSDVQVSVLESIKGLITAIFSRLPFLVAGIIVMFLFWVLAKMIRSGFMAATRRAKVDTRLRLLISRMLAGLVYTLGIFTALTVIIPSFNFASLIAGLGFTSFVVGFATKDILNNFLSGILILWHQPFHIGDYLFIGSNQGKVEYIGVRATSLRKDDGELVLIPNGDMYSNALTIRGKGAKRRMQLKFNLDYQADIEQAKTVTFEALVRTQGIVPEPQPNVYVADLNSEGVLVTANFWLDTNENRPLTVFDQAAIEVMKSLTGAGYELFPPGSMIVKQPDGSPSPANQPAAKKEMFGE